MSKVLRVNTTRGTLKTEESKKDSQYFGGRGLIAKLMTAEVDPKCDPLGPDNKLIVATGILAGTSVSTGHRFSVGGKSPLTGGIKEANVGGTAGYLMAGHGIKMIVLEGAPSGDKWRLLRIDASGKPELISADGYAGLNNYALVEKLKAKFGKGVGVISIGNAGERGYKNSTVQVTDATTGHPSRAAARGGLGAVMGAKKIKAIVIEPPASRQAFPYVNKAKFDAANKKLVDATLAEGSFARGFTNIGTINTVSMTGYTGMLPVRNYSGEYFGADRLQKIDGAAFLAKLKENGGKNGIPCQPGCLVRCSNYYNDSKGQYLTGGLEYETVGLLGSNCDIDDLDWIAQADRLCDDLGIDTIETGATIGVCMDAGKIPWGDKKAAMGLLKEMVDGTAFGNLMGQGTAAVGKKLKAKRIPVAKGQAMAAYDPRNAQAIGVTYATSPMGGDHTAGTAMMPFADMMGKPMRSGMSGRTQMGQAFTDSLMCSFQFGLTNSDPTILPDLLNGAVGGDWDADKIAQAGRDIINLELEYNKGAGFTKKDTRLPEFFYTEVSLATGAIYDLTADDLVDTFK
jgi:aldehyde:ferredoxin oxidoreductase